MADKKSILEEAMLDINNIQNALNANTKEILRSVAREEINGIVKESVEKDFEEEDVEDESKEEVTEGFEDMENMEDSEEEEGMAPKMDSEMGSEMGDEDGIETLGGSDMGDEDLGDIEGGLGMDDVDTSDDLNMTGASDEDVIAIYKKLSGEDEIEIVGDEIHLNVSEPGEYVVKLDNGSAPMGGAEDELDLEPTGDEDMEMDGEDMGDEDGEDMDYEIELDDEEGDDEEGESPEHEAGESDEFEAGEDEEASEDDEEDEEELEENIGHVNGYAGRQGQRRNGASHLGFGKKSVDGERLDESLNKAKQIVSETAKKYNSLLTEATKLKSENEEFRKALKEFRTKLVETVVFNSNLTYVTKLFMEHSTTKGEKQNIIKRFDEEVTNLKESKRLYKNIGNELVSRKPIAESVENKIIKEATSSTSKQLNESTAYVDPSTSRIMDLIKRVERR